MLWWHSGDLHMAPRFSIFSKKQRQKQGIDFSVILNWQLFSTRLILQPIVPEGGDSQYTFLAFYCWKSICMCCWKCVCGVGRMYLLLEICRYNTVQILHCRVRWQVLCQKEGPTRHSGLDSLPKSDGTLLWRIRFCRTKPKYLNICYNLAEM